METFSNSYGVPIHGNDGFDLVSNYETDFVKSNMRMNACIFATARWTTNKN